MVKAEKNNIQDSKKLFGTFSGVFVPSFEAILGAVLFLILPMLAGTMGLWKMILIVVISNTVTVATAFSISDCATNIDRVGPGGMYAVSRRSLGRAFGGSIGIQLFLAQSASIGFYTIGFAEPLQTVLIKIPVINSYIGSYDVLMQKQIIATLIATLVFILAIIGAHFIIKIQMVVFAVLIAALGAILFSPVIIPFTASVSGGSGIFSGGLNFHGFGSAMGFWAAFTAFFPAVTFVYALIRPELLMVTKKGQIPSVVNVFSGYPFIAILLLIGILVATGSSALSYFMTAPRTAQAMAQDRILPKGLFSLARLFSLDRLFFTRELEKFLDFPPVLFVKASQIFDLVEE